MNARIGTRPYLAYTQHQYARMLLARNQPGDRDQVTSLLEEALTTARALGMRAIEERLASLLTPTVPAPVAVPISTMLPIPDELSQRELEVPPLLAAGKSNRGIADALFISLNTVTTHVRNILTKTGCTNRTEAAAYALRHGLLSSP